MLDIRRQSAEVRTGIVGTGFIGRIHARAVRQAGARLVGVAGADRDDAIRGAEAVGAEKAFDSAEELIGSGLIDVLHVCTPNHLHAPIALKALDAGLAVICEKPLATDAATAALMAERAHDTGAVAAVPFVYRFHPMVREARARLAGLGRISLVQGGYLQDWLLESSDDNWRIDPAKGGPGRTIGDIGSHWFDLVEFVTGDRITRVCAQTAVTVADRASGPVLTEDLATVQFTTASGALGTVCVSQVAAGRKNRLFLEVSAATGSLAFDQENPEQLWLGGRSGSQALVRDPKTLSPEALRYAPLPAGHPQGFHDCFNAFVDDTYAAIRGEHREGLPTFQDGARAAHLTDAALRSAHEGRWVPC
ncbi:Gfo/Idh/MocA family oxidoreductase [Kitasatospora terrestris]|uniref:Gfo/Idh/MocA family oxidoreductase n=1 Tax=Kitasatospora terrestris TaxID=258051 RepID=A0ABP9DEK9_9ACTN